MSLIQRGRFAALRRMSALRQAFVLTAAFLLLLAFAGALALSEFERVFDNRIEAELETRFETVASDIEARGFDPSSYPQTQIERIRFVDSDRRVRPGFYDDLDIRWGRPRDHDFGGNNWMYYVGNVDGGQLIVGTSLGRFNDFLEIILQTLAFVGFCAAVLALVIGVILGLRSQRRLNAINRTLQAAAGGDLTARVDAKRSKDDLDDLSDQVDETIAQLDLLMRQTRDFSANIAHDLKTPLARLRIRLENALIAENDHGDSEEFIGAALEQADKVIGIFDAFLRIAKLESGAAKANFELLDLGEIAREVADIYDVVVEDGGRSLVLDLDRPARVQGDRVLLIQMLANLIENAMRHTPEGTELRLVAQGKTLGLADTGPGIPAEEYDRITQPLYRLEKSRTTEGAGLGLSLVKTIAGLHKAELVFSDTPYANHGLFVRAEF